MTLRSLAPEASASAIPPLAPVQCPTLQTFEDLRNPRGLPERLTPRDP